MQPQPSSQPLLRQPVALHIVPLPQQSLVSYQPSLLTAYQPCSPSKLSPLSLCVSDSPASPSSESLPTFETILMDASPCSTPQPEGSTVAQSNQEQQDAHSSQRDLYWKTVLRSDVPPALEARTDIVKKEFKYSGLRYHCKVLGCTQMFRHRSSRSRHQKKFHPGSAV